MGHIHEVQTLAGHTDRAWHVAWNPAHPTLASCSTDKSVRLYSYSPSPSPSAAGPSNFHLSSTIPTSHSRTVRSLAFSPTGATLTTASFDSTVGIWCQTSEAGLDDGPGRGGGGAPGSSDAQWEAVDPLEGHESECKSVAWSADGRLLASCSRDKSVWVWEAVGPADFECLAVLMEHSQDVKCVTWHPTDELLASASYDDTIKLYAADPFDDEWTCIHTLVPSSSPGTPPPGTVWTLSFSPCGRYLASGGDDCSIRLWERVPRDSPTTLRDAEAGEARPQEGGRMGPWSAQGVRIGMGERYTWEERGVICGGEGEGDAHERTVYAVDWQKGGLAEEEGGLGRIVSGGGDGRINVFQMTAPPADAPPAAAGPQWRLVARVEDAHGVSDVNHVAWCVLDPAKAAATLRALEGGEDEEEEEGGEEHREDGERWKGARDCFASAGDDGLVKVWRVEP
ncbi:WD40 repeat-like protein [Rhodotorula diobovata]|uniref:Probable cytosolic iron-sulfur protein assembly protein 1 n=1 Tax=Rhodotorula diobovata TaxID=5288 RepID=A0A5C5FRD2_9BASI|nr:WD40 repeat-like protein [Rhodotorula diobovata]